MRALGGNSQKAAHQNTKPAGAGYRQAESVVLFGALVPRADPVTAIQEMTVPTVGGSVSAGSATQAMSSRTISHREASPTWPVKAASKALLTIMARDVAAPASPASNTGMAPLDGRYDHAAADDARRSLRTEEAPPWVA